MKLLKVACVLTLGAVRAVGVPQVSASNNDDAATKGQMEGRVVSLTTKEPLRGATVKLRRAVFAAAPTEAAYTGRTDESGKFILPSVRVGEYWLVAERTGYVQQAYGSRPGFTMGTVLKVNAGQTTKDLMLALTPQGTISGRVTDETGEPVTDTKITALVLPFGVGLRMLRPVSSAEINVAGGFVVGGLPPGRYYLRVNGPRAVSQAASPEARAEPAEESNVSTFYPRSLDVSSASPIDVTAGAEVTGISIVVRKSRVYRVRGKVRTAGTAAPTFLGLVPKGFDLLAVTAHKMAQIGKDGTFQFSQVPPGEYVIEPDFGPRRTIGRADVTVTEQNVENVIVEIREPIEIAGKVRIEGAEKAGSQSPTASVVAYEPPGTAGDTRTTKSAAPPVAGSQPVDGPDNRSVLPPPPPVNVPGSIPSGPGSGLAANVTELGLLGQGSATPAEGLVSLAQSHLGLGVEDRIAFLPQPFVMVGADGTFRLPVGLDRYRVNISPLPPRTYVKSISINGQNLSDFVLDTSSGASGSLEIVLSPNAADLTGTVRDSDGKALSGVVVSAWNSDSNDQVHSSISNGTGNFQIGNLAPGKYWVVAWEEINPDLAKYRKFCGIFENKAEFVEVTEKTQAVVTPKIVPRQLIAVEAAKVD